MRLFEHKTRDIFTKFGISLPKGGLAAFPEEAKRLAAEIKGPVTLRACTLGETPPSQLASSPEATFKIAGELLGATLEGHPVDRVLVQEAVEPQKAVYAYVSLDRWEEKPFLLVSGKDIENIYSSPYLKQVGTPYEHFSLPEGLQPFETRALAKAAGFSGRDINTLGTILWNLHRIWMTYDAEYVSLAPLLQAKDGRFLAQTIVLSLDEDALLRHRDLQAEEEKMGLSTENERRSQAEGTPWVDLEGDIGMFVAGSGMGQTANDMVVLAGGRPANFSDVGGGPSPERVAKAFALIFNNSRLKGCFAFYYGGISRCDDFAKGLILAIEQHRPQMPVVVKIAGTNEKEGRQILDQAMAQKPELFSGIQFVGGMETTVNDLAKKIVEATRGR